MAFVDISDTTQSPSGSLVKGTLTEFFAQLPVPVAIKSASATALTVGLNGATNPVLAVDASTASQVAGVKVVGAVTGGTVAVVVTDSGADANLTVNAKGSGTIGIGSVSTGRVTITPATTIGGVLTIDTDGMAGSSFRLTKSGGNAGLSAANFNTNGDNVQVGFDVDYSSGWVARNATVAWLSKLNGALSIFGSGGNVVDGPATQTSILEINLTSRAVAFNGAVTGVTSLSAGATTLTSSSATALAVGPSGTTTPIFAVDASPALAVAGLKVAGAATGGTVAVVVTDSGSDASLSINAKGTGATFLNGAETVAATLVSTGVIIGTVARVVRAANVPILNTIRVNGTLAVPTALASGDEIGRHSFNGCVDSSTLYDASRLAVFATQNWTSSNRGAKAILYVTKNNQSSVTATLTLDQDFSALFAGVGAFGGASVSSSTSLNLPASTTSVSSLRLAAGSAPAAPVDGDFWRTAGSLFARIGSVSVDLPWRSLLGGTLTNSTCAASTTAYVIMGAGTLGGTVENTRQWVMSTDCTLRNLYVTTNGAQPGDGAFVWTVRKNGVNTGITLTIAAGAAAGTFSDTTHSASFAAGDLLSISAANASASPSATVNSWSLLGQPL